LATQQFEPPAKVDAVQTAAAIVPIQNQERLRISHLSSAPPGFGAALDRPDHETTSDQSGRLDPL
jgi:hypothetical protein